VLDPLPASTMSTPPSPTTTTGPFLRAQRKPGGHCAEEPGQRFPCVCVDQGYHAQLPQTPQARLGRTAPGSLAHNSRAEVGGRRVTFDPGAGAGGAR